MKKSIIIIVLFLLAGSLTVRAGVKSGPYSFIDPGRNLTYLSVIPKKNHGQGCTSRTCDHGLRVFNGAKGSRVTKPPSGIKNTRIPLITNDVKGFDLSLENFMIFVPESYSDRVPHGLMVFISPVDNMTFFSLHWAELFAEEKIIWIAAFRGGNRQPIDRRIRLALEARKHVVENYNIDPDRIYVSGFSMAGSAASALLYQFPDAFNGSTHFCGALRLDKEKVSKEAIRKLLEKRVFIVTGTKDEFRPDCVAAADSLKEVGIKTVLLDIPELEHTIPYDAGIMEKILKFLDGHSKGRG